MARCYGQPPSHPLLECLFVRMKRRGEELPKKEEKKNELLVLIQIGSDWWDLALRVPVPYSQLLIVAQIEHLTLFSTHLVRGPVSDNNLTLFFWPRLSQPASPLQPFPRHICPPHLHSMCETCYTVGLSQDHLSKTSRLLGHTWTEAFRSGSPLQACCRGIRRFEKGLTGVWENLLELRRRGNALLWNASPFRVLPCHAPSNSLWKRP